MAEEFVPDIDSQSSQIDAPAVFSREPIKHALYGSKQAIAHTIHTLYLQGYAEPGAWSRPQATQQPGEFVSLLIRYLMLRT